MLSDVIDVEGALEMCGDMEFLEEMVELFNEDLIKCIPLLQEAHSNRDTQSIQKISHRIKGQALSLSCTKLTNGCSTLEINSSSGVYTDGEYNTVMNSIHEFIKCSTEKK